MTNPDQQPEARPPQSQDQVYGKPPGAGDWKRISRIVALGVLVVYVVLFFVLNQETVPVSLVVTTVTIPLIWILVGTFIMGGVVTYLLLYLRRRSARKGGDT